MSEHVELFPGQHQAVLSYCKARAQQGLPWCRLAEIEDAAQCAPAGGAVMALREQGKLRTQIGPHGRVEIMAREVAGG